MPANYLSLFDRDEKLMNGNDHRDPGTPAGDATRRFSDLQKVKDYYASHAPDYDKDYDALLWRLYNDLTWAFMEPFLPPLYEIQGGAPKVLDTGCGTGKWAIKLASMGYKVTCGDISDAMLDLAREEAGQTGIDGIDIEFIPSLDIRRMDAIPSGAFDVVLALGDVISYAMDDDPAVAEMFRTCKPGGIAIASMDSTFTYVVHEIKNERWDRIDPLLDTGVTNAFLPHPIKTYLPAQATALFERHGFHVLQVAGKPVFSNALPRKIARRKLERNYDKMLAIEKQFSADPAFVGHGGHLQVTARRPGA